MEGVADVRPAENDNGKLPENAIDIYFIDGKILTLCAESNSDMLAWIKAFSVFVFVQQKENAKSVIEGPLEHSLDHGNTWEMRYVILNPDRILVYEKAGDVQAKAGNERPKPLSVLTFTEEFYCSDGKGGNWAFQVSDFDTTYYFSAPDEQHQMFWMHAIARIIRKLRAEREHASSVIENQVASGATNPMFGAVTNGVSDTTENVVEELDLSKIKPGTAQLLYDFVAESEGEISVPVDEFVQLVEKLDEDFWVVDYNGTRGFVQNDYMEILKPLAPKRAVKRASLKARRASLKISSAGGPPGAPPGAPPYVDAQPYAGRNAEANEREVEEAKKKEEDIRANLAAEEARKQH